jgi:uncharacterized membrane protein YdbT with pleckstrin-like domain
MSTEPKKMKPIWYLVGLVLLVMGLIIVAAGIFSGAQAAVLGHLHTNLWWGLVMIGTGLIFLVTNWKKTVE